MANESVPKRPRTSLAVAKIERLQGAGDPQPSDARIETEVEAAQGQAGESPASERACGLSRRGVCSRGARGVRGEGRGPGLGLRSARCVSFWVGGERERELLKAQM